ncbi:hypothetical protein IEQ34_021601 [Dendrobium chrysotoxum]|uniref:Pre-rRNA-processing protein TSR2 homolog n=1 Tax=Dendrobium chrysotoxum TaxID=161865 RepID=A0AAV7G4L1_DENCH|nr:hypothetical protein IEQ34_021601 [Dendrobium chrysotoxum]
MDFGGCVERSSALSLESMEVLQEGISLLLSQWPALQMAVRHEWGGCDSRRKCDELAATLLSWFCQSKAPVSIDDLENVLDENLLLSFNTEIVDGSVEEIAEQLLLMHEDCLCGNYYMIQKLRR